MRVLGRGRPRLWLGALAAAGVGLTHAVAYFLTAPDPEARRELLEQTAHGYWSYASAVALGLLVAGLSGFAIARVRERAEQRRAGGSLYLFIATRLIVLQGLGFLVLEASERAVAGQLDHFLAEPVVLLGVVIQAVVAVIGAALLVMLARLVETLVSGRSSIFVRPPSRTFAPILSIPQPHTYIGAGGAAPRAPPTF